MLGRIFTAVLNFFRNLPRWFWTTYFWPLLAVPVIYIAAIYLLADADFLGWNNYRVHKAQFEIVHPVVLAAGSVIALIARARIADTSLTFLAAICGFCFMRELGGQGTSTFLYLSFLGLIAYWHLRRSKLNTLGDSPMALSSMATGLLSYAGSQFLDRGLIDRIGRLFVEDPSWRVPYTSQIEESLEALGGAFLLLTVVCVVILACRARKRADEQGPLIA